MRDVIAQWKAVLSRQFQFCFAEWIGLYAIGVGLYGASLRPVTQHYLMWGVIRLDWFYHALTLLGLLALFFGGPPGDGVVRPDTAWAWLLLVARFLLTLGMLAVLTWYAVLR